MAALTGSLILTGCAMGGGDTPRRPVVSVTDEVQAIDREALVGTWECRELNSYPEIPQVTTRTTYRADGTFTSEGRSAPRPPFGSMEIEAKGRWAVEGQQVTTSGVETEASSATVALAAAAQQIATERAAAEAAAAEIRSRESRWQALGREAVQEYEAMRARLLAEVEAVSADVNLSRHGLQWGAATLALQDPAIVPFGLSPAGRQIVQQQWDRPRWDVVAWALTSLECRHGVGGRSYRYGSTLFFGRPIDAEGYRWYEVSFWTFRDENGPHGLDMSGHDAMTALSPTLGVANVAFGPQAIDAEDEDRFQNRWLSLIARAAAGQLHRPSQMPPPLSFYD